MTTGKMESKTQSKLMQNAEKAKPGAEMERLLGRLDGELKAMEFGPKDKGIVKSAEALAGFKKGLHRYHQEISPTINGWRGWLDAWES